MIGNIGCGVMSYTMCGNNRSHCQCMKGAIWEDVKMYGTFDHAPLQSGFWASSIQSSRRVERFTRSVVARPGQLSHGEQHGPTG